MASYRLSLSGYRGVCRMKSERPVFANYFGGGSGGGVAPGKLPAQVVCPGAGAIATPRNSNPDRSQTWAKPFWFRRSHSPAPRSPTPRNRTPRNRPPRSRRTKPEKINPNDIYTLSTSTNLVNVDVMVVDNSGSPLQNLGKKNFQLYRRRRPASHHQLRNRRSPHDHLFAG